MALRKNTSPDVTWRDKYLELHHQFEELKLTAKERDRMLSKAFSLASVMSQGQSPSVDTSLAALKKALREDDSAGFNKQVDKFEQETLSYDHAFHLESDKLSTRIRAMADVLLQQKFPVELSDFITELRSSADSALQSWDGYSRQLNGWARVLTYLAKQKLPPAAPPEDTSDSAAGTEDVLPLSSVAEVLDGLIGRLVVPAELVPRSQHLRQAIKNITSVERLLTLFEDVALFMYECQNGRNEFERFLESLDGRLQAIQAIVADVNASQSERESARQELDHMVRHQIEDIRKDVKDSGEINSTIRDHLQYIIKAMESYNHQETEREQRLTSQLQQLHIFEALIPL